MLQPHFLWSCSLNFTMDRLPSPKELGWQPTGVHSADVAKPSVCFFGFVLRLKVGSHTVYANCSIYLRHLIWKTSSLFMSGLGRVHVSNLYMKIGRISVQKKLILFLVEMFLADTLERFPDWFGCSGRCQFLLLHQWYLNSWTCSIWTRSICHLWSRPHWFLDCRIGRCGKRLVGGFCICVGEYGTAVCKHQAGQEAVYVVQNSTSVLECFPY